MFFPDMPPMLEGESPTEYTNRLTGADHTGRVPYAERRNRQCSIGYHDECSDPLGEVCKCPCHAIRAAAPDLLKACEAARTTLQLVSDGQAYDGTALATTMLNTIKRLSAAIAAAGGIERRS